jgi:hypothetical protein
MSEEEPVIVGETEGTHWRTGFSSQFVHAEDLKGKAHDVIIESVKLEVLQIPRKKEKEKKWVIKFQGRPKGMVLNKTNAQAIAKRTGENVVEKWVGKTITLYPTTDRLGADVVPCIRIK